MILKDFNNHQSVADTFIPYMTLKSIVGALTVDQLKELTLKISEALIETEEPPVFNQIADLIRPYNNAIARAY